MSLRLGYTCTDMTHAQFARRARLQSAMARQASAAGPDPQSALKDLRAYPLREPDSGRNYTLVRLETRGGLVGWGECGAAGDTAGALRALDGVAANSYEVAWRRLEAFPALRPGIDMA